jgi:hypoxanthine phosphoribosyltransferase
MEPQNKIKQIRDKNFELLISEEELRTRVLELGRELSEVYENRNPLFIAILNGSFIFAADLIRGIHIPSEISFIKLASYSNFQSTGKIRELIGLEKNIFKREIVLIDDIIDSGNTMAWLIDHLKELGPASIELVSLLIKPDAMTNKLKPGYTGFKISNKFVIGYGLDYDGYGRNLKDIYQLAQ